MKLRFLKNKYVLLRHGESVGNVKHLINSNPDTADSSFPLTKRGKRQAKRAANRLYKIFRKDDIVIISSNFTRAKQTAEIVTLKFKTSFTSTPALNERFFGEHDEKNSKWYKLTWKIDRVAPNFDVDGVESVYSVMKRVSSFVYELESQHKNKTIILVSHGDPLKFLEFCFLRSNYVFTLLPHVLKNCEFKTIENF